MRFDAQDAPTDPRPVMGLLILSSDETLEQDMRALLPSDAVILHSARVSNAANVSTDSLAAMSDTLTPAAASLPSTPNYAVIGYGCTSATAVLGRHRVAELVRAGRLTNAVSTPLDGLIAACDTLGVSRPALLSPYVEEVSDRLRRSLQESGIDTPVFGTFAEPSEPRVARIDPQATYRAACSLAERTDVDAIFLSCTNLQTLPVIEAIEATTGLPVLSSNLVLAWHMARLAGLSGLPRPVGRLGALRPKM